MLLAWDLVPRHPLESQEDLPPQVFLTETTSWILPILLGRLLTILRPLGLVVRESKSTPQPSSATSARNGLLGRTIYDRTYALTRTSDLLYVHIAEKRSQDNTTGNDMKVYIPGRRSLCVAAN